MAIPGRHPMEEEIDLLVEKRLRTATQPAQDGDAVKTLDDWLTIRLRLIEQIADPAQDEIVLAELKYLCDQAFVPGTSDHVLSPIELLVQYAFVEWTKQDPEKALALEGKWNPRPTTRDWRPLEAILFEWRRTDPAAALQALLERFEHEPDAHQGGPGGFLSLYLEDPTVLFTRTKDVGHQWLVSELRSLAKLWHRHDEAAMEAFFAEHPRHPANPQTR